MNTSNERDEEDEDLDDADIDELLSVDEVDLDRGYKDMEIAKRRASRSGEPAWRRLEQRMERKHTAELISDLEDYDLDDVVLATVGR